jgi:hypothetical protein
MTVDLKVKCPGILDDSRARDGKLLLTFLWCYVGVVWRGQALVSLIFPKFSGPEWMFGLGLAANFSR